MKIKLKRNISTGLAVRTTLKAGEDYVPCGCASVKNAGWQCDDGKENSEMVRSVPEISSWMQKYCSGPDELMFHNNTPIKPDLDLS